MSTSDFEERVVTVPLRDANDKPIQERADFAMKIVREHLAQHFSDEAEVVLDTTVNEAVWANGRQNPRARSASARPGSSRTASPSSKPSTPSSVLRATFTGSSYVGVFARAIDDLLLVRPDVDEELADALGEELGAEPLLTTVGGANTVGSLATGNENGVLVSRAATEREQSRIAEAADCEVGELPGEINAAGNVVLERLRCVRPPGPPARVDRDDQRDPRRPRGPWRSRRRADGRHRCGRQQHGRALSPQIDRIGAPSGRGGARRARRSGTINYGAPLIGSGLSPPTKDTSSARTPPVPNWVGSRRRSASSTEAEAHPVETPPHPGESRSVRRFCPFLSLNAELRAVCPPSNVGPLTKYYGDVRDRRRVVCRRGWRGVRLLRAERRRKDDRDPHPPRVPVADERGATLIGHDAHLTGGRRPTGSRSAACSRCSCLIRSRPAASTLGWGSISPTAHYDPLRTARERRVRHRRCSRPVHGDACARTPRGLPVPAGRPRQLTVCSVVTDSGA